MRNLDKAALLFLGAAIVLLIEPTAENEVRKIMGGSREPEFEPLIQKIADRYGFDPNVLRAIIRTESNYKADAVSLDGQDIGLAGVRIGTARLFRKEWKALDSDTIKTYLMDPETNLDLSGRVIGELTDHGLGSSPALFHAYNIGETKYRAGVRSPFVDRYVVAYNDYTEATA